MGLNDMHAGILYIATTERYVQEAVHSLETVKERMPDVKVGIYTDMVERVDGKGFDIVQEIPNPRYNFFDKVEYCTRSPFSKTLFLDTDKEMIEPCYELFDLLETGQFKTQFDYAVCADDVKYEKTENEVSFRCHIQLLEFKEEVCGNEMGIFFQ